MGKQHHLRSNFSSEDQNYELRIQGCSSSSAVQLLHANYAKIFFWG